MTEAPARMLTFRSGGWILLLTTLVAMALVVWAVAPALLRQANRPPGDGETLESYAFDLDPMLVPRELVVPAMLHRDMSPAMTNPDVLTVDEVARLNEETRGNYLVSDDVVIGVVVGDVARAYPISVLNIHEVVNDTLGPSGNQVSIAVTYHWPTGAAAVFDRTVAGETLEFGVSGLVYNQNLLMYARRNGEPGDESLWSQLEARAVTGDAAAAGLTLDVLPATLVRWDDWVASHPDTTVIARIERWARRYKDGDPSAYFASDALLPDAVVDPLPPHDGPKLKMRVVIVSSGGERRAYSYPLIADQVQESESNAWIDRVGGTRVEFSYSRSPELVRVRALDPAPDLGVIYALWFAWHAIEPETQLAVKPPA